MTQKTLAEKIEEAQRIENSNMFGLLDEANQYAEQGNVHYMERALLGIAASGIQNRLYINLTEQIQVKGYTKMITSVIRTIHEMSDEEKEKKLHQYVFSLLHSGSMTHEIAFKGALQIALKIDHPEAKKAIRDFYPSISYEKQSMMEHHKARNEMNRDYFANIQSIMLQEMPSLTNVRTKHEKYFQL